MKKHQMDLHDPKDARSLRIPHRLPPELGARVISYATAAGAAGVGMLALAPAAKADIVYTRANIPLFAGADVGFAVVPGTSLGRYDIVDGGGSRSAPHGGRDVYGHLRAYILGGASSSTRGFNLLNTGKLHGGERIGPSMHFGTAGITTLATFFRSFSFDGGTRFGFSSGPWARGGVGFLGLEFTIHGQVHFGWAELDIEHIDLGRGGYDGKLIGYAYETVPNQGLLAGEGNGTPEPGTLGLLALGSLGLGLWRRKEHGQEVANRE